MVDPVKKTTGNRKNLFTGEPGPGRPKGVPNKTTTQLKEAILEAATAAGGTTGLVGYLQTQAAINPTSFMGLLGKVLPMTVIGDGENPIQINVTIGGK